MIFDFVGKKTKSTSHKLAVSQWHKAGFSQEKLLGSRLSACNTTCTVWQSQHRLVHLVQLHT